MQPIVIAGQLTPPAGDRGRFPHCACSPDPLAAVASAGGTGMVAHLSLTALMPSAAEVRPLAMSCSVLVRKSCASPESGGFLAREKPSSSAGQKCAFLA